MFLNELPRLRSECAFVMRTSNLLTHLRALSVNSYNPPTHSSTPSYDDTLRRHTMSLQQTETGVIRWRRTPTTNGMSPLPSVRPQPSERSKDDNGQCALIAYDGKTSNAEAAEGDDDSTPV